MSTREALSKSSHYWYDPKDLILIKDPDHPLYDPRVTEALDEGLILSIAQHGIHDPVQVWTSKTDGGIVVLDGRHRVRAALEANKRGAQVRVPCLFTRLDPQVAHAIGNMHRKEETTLQIARKAAKLHANGHTPAELARVFSVDPSTVAKWLALASAPAPIHRALEAGEIGVKAAYAIARMSDGDQAAALAQAKAEPIKGVDQAEKAKRAATGAGRPKGPTGRPGKLQIAAVHAACLESGADRAQPWATVLGWVLGLDEPPAWVAKILADS